jgi:ADP-ribose pyrophosphatase YjhB (NUDIX family)
MQIPKVPQFDRFKKYFQRRKPAIQEVVREQTAGGIVFRRSKKGEDIEILLTQDAKDRWTIAKGHIEEGETAKECAEREVREETGLQRMEVMSWLGKIHFRYRRQQSLVLMTTQIYLIRALDDADALTKEDWMNGIGWFKVNEALDMIEYEDISKLLLVALKKIRHAGY